MIGSILFFREKRELGTFLETFCPVCRDIILDPSDTGEAVRCEGDGSSPVTCEAILHRSCAEIIVGEYTCQECAPALRVFVEAGKVFCNPPAPPDRTGPVAGLSGVQVGGLFE